jgi:hypothetical protein
MITVEQRAQQRRKAPGGHHAFPGGGEVRPGSKVVVEVDNDRAITLQELATSTKPYAMTWVRPPTIASFSSAARAWVAPSRWMRQYQKHTGRLVQVVLARWQQAGRQVGAVRWHHHGPAHPAPEQGERPPAQTGRGDTMIPFAEIKSTQASITFN